MKRRSREIRAGRIFDRLLAFCPAGLISLAIFHGNCIHAEPGDDRLVVDDFDRPDSLYHGDGWESLNPGYWKIESSALRRRFGNVGERARASGYPWHWESTFGTPMPVKYDPSLPFGMLWRRDWNLKGDFSIGLEATIHSLPPELPENPHWKQHQPGYALLGICFAGQSPLESWYRAGSSEDAALFAALRDDGSFGVYSHSADESFSDGTPASMPAPGEEISIEIHVASDVPGRATLTAKLVRQGKETVVVLPDMARSTTFGGHFGVVARGLLDFEINRVWLVPGNNRRVDYALNETRVCYPLGDTLRKTDAGWVCKFVAAFRNPGEQANIRIGLTPQPTEGWEKIPIAGSAPIISNDFRLNTSAIEVELPFSPGEKEMFYTIWKDGRNVTDDPREGFLGRKRYVGRLPRLKAPYRLCGLGGHILGGSPDYPDRQPFQKNWIHTQPTQDAYQHLDEFDFQVMLWEDDVWYLERVIFPPSVDDAYKIIMLTIANPTTRWQMMRHWNVINPGDHDYGMDDTKGPEQYLLRNHCDLGQDCEYMRRNFQIVAHLARGAENPSATENPKMWRRWKMPDRDFSLVLVDSRMWRTSQDTQIWDDQGWGHKRNTHDRSNPTRTLLGEEQFAWLTQVVHTDSSPLICVSGLNALHTIWSGQTKNPETGLWWDQKDRVTADYAGWVKAGADRAIDLLGSRSGIVSIYGDVHAACILKNTKHRLFEGAFGPLSAQGSRRVKEEFGPKMTDYDGREVEVHALYHTSYGSPALEKRTGPRSWNFMEMEFNPTGEDPWFSLKIRNLIDNATDVPRGGGHVKESASVTGRIPSCSVPPVQTLPNADVLISSANGIPIRGTRSLEDGKVPIQALVDVDPGTLVLLRAFDGNETDSQVVETLPFEEVGP